MLPWSSWLLVFFPNTCDVVVCAPLRVKWLGLCGTYSHGDGKSVDITGAVGGRAARNPLQVSLLVPVVSCCVRFTDSVCVFLVCCLNCRSTSETRWKRWSGQCHGLPSTRRLRFSVRYTHATATYTIHMGVNRTAVLCCIVENLLDRENIHRLHAFVFFH